MVVEKSYSSQADQESHQPTESKFGDEEFYVLEIPSYPEDVNSLSEQEIRKIREKRALYEALSRFLEELKPIQETFEKHGVPLVITRSIAVYLWAMRLNQGHVIPISLGRREMIGVHGDILKDIDYLVPVEMSPEVDAALAELVSINKIRVRDKAESAKEIHARGFKSYLYRQFTVLDEQGQNLIDVDMFGGFGSYVNRESDGELDHQTFQAVTLDDDNQVVALRNQGDDLVQSRNTDLRRVRVGNANVRFLVGEGLKSSYDAEMKRISSREGGQGVTDEQLIKETRLRWKLRLIGSFLGNDPVYRNSFSKN